MSSQAQIQAMRLDKWLWCARFYKTRSLASNAIKSGKVKRRAAKVKPSQLITIGETLEIKKTPYIWEINVLDLAKTRGSAQIAEQLYKESPQSKENRELVKNQLRLTDATQNKTRRKPEKRERQKIIRFTRDPSL